MSKYRFNMTVQKLEAMYLEMAAWFYLPIWLKYSLRWGTTSPQIAGYSVAWYRQHAIWRMCKYLQHGCWIAFWELTINIAQATSGFKFRCRSTKLYVLIALLHYFKCLAAISLTDIFVWTIFRRSCSNHFILHLEHVSMERLVYIFWSL